MPCSSPYYKHLGDQIGLTETSTESKLQSHVHGYNIYICRNQILDYLYRQGFVQAMLAHLSSPGRKTPRDLSDQSQLSSTTTFSNIIIHKCKVLEKILSHNKETMHLQNVHKKREGLHLNKLFLILRQLLMQ